MRRRPPRPTLFPYTTLFRSGACTRLCTHEPGLDRADSGRSQVRRHRDRADDSDDRRRHVDVLWPTLRLADDEAPRRTVEPALNPGQGCRPKKGVTAELIEWHAGEQRVVHHIGVADFVLVAVVVLASTRYRRSLAGTGSLRRRDARTPGHKYETGSKYDPA